MTEPIPKFNTGDRVRIIKYGSLFWENKTVGQPSTNLPVVGETETVFFKDMNPELVGQIGIVEKFTITQGNVKYALQGLSKHAWYDEGQLEIVETK